MRLQSTEASCGPTAMANALSALGIKRDLEECETLCRCDAATGTSTQQLTRALKTIPNLMVNRIYEKKPSSALWHLNACLSLGRPVILCVDSSGHWVSAVGQLGVGTLTARYVVADSGDMELVLTYDFKDLLTRWGDKGDKKTTYLGISL